MAPAGPPLPLPSRQRPKLLWLSISRVPDAILDSTLRRFLFTSASELVVVNGELEGYADLVHAIKTQFPSLKVLRYTNAQRIPAGTRVASTMYCHFLEHVYTQVLRLRTGVPKIDGDGMIFTDITNPDTRAFIVAHLVQQVAAHGVDGVAVDSCHVDLRDPDTYLDGAEKADKWPGAVRRILQGLRDALPGKKVWFNGLWAFDAAKLEAQEDLLDAADGASVEFYGYDGRPNPATPSHDSFGTFVGPVNEVLSRHPNTPILVRGTPTGDDYYDYLPSLQQARYCYGCFLIGQTPGASFSYGQDFLVTRLLSHRTNATSMFSYFEFALGAPMGNAIHNGSGGWSREYAHGAVFVAADMAGVTTQEWVLTSGWWTTLGRKLPAGRTIALEPGDAAILLRRRPQPPPTELDLDLPTSANDHLVEGVTGEWLVQGVTSEYHYQQMILTVRSTDPKSAVLVRFETNDRPPNRTRPFGILTILPDGGDFDAGNHDYPYGQNATLGAVQATCSQRYPIDGTSTVLPIDLARECDPFACFRVMSVRAIGAVDVDGIRLGKLSPIPGV
jgi:Hypothetical glycosyl hydrolase family 15